VFSWGILATIVPLPWSFIIMLILLAIYWKYFSGSWWPGSTSVFRKENIRKTKLTWNELRMGLVAALLIVLIEQSGLVVTFRILEFPVEKFLHEYSFFNNIPVWAAYLVIFMISLVAGVCEETGFRGYMQVPLEKKYGKLIAISIVSVVFVLVHLHQAWSGPIILHIFFISVLFGVLASVTDSLIPGIISHFVMDIFNFTFWWADLGFQFNQLPINKTGMDVHFVFFVLTFISGLLAFIYIIRKIVETRSTH